MTAAMRRFGPYPAYKDSGVEWLEKIPKHWEVRRLKHLASLNPEALAEDSDPTLEMVYVDISGVDSLGNIGDRESLLFGAAPSRARRRVRAGDVIVSTVRTYLRAIAPIANPEPNLVVSTGFAVVRPRNGLVSDYAAYALRAPYFVERVVANSKGVSFPAISESEMGSFELTVPPTQEQRAIATFLNAETARIDALVAKKERLIELLREKRTALITQAATKGLDPNVSMKTSGVEWLGEIPDHWDLTKMWDATWTTSGATPPKETLGYWDGGIPWISAKDMKRRFIDSSEDTVSEAAISEIGLKLIPAGAVLVVVRGMILAHTLPVAITTVPVTINQDMKAVSVREKLTTRYFAYWLEGVGHSLREVLVEEAAHGTKAIRMDRWRVTPIQIPPIHEQNAIAVFLDGETARIDSLIEKVQVAVARLRELRGALISAAITGKIDVREGAA